MAEETLKEKTAKGLFWGGISNGLQQIISVVLGVVLLRILDVKDYGLIGMLAIFTGIANTILDSGFTAALINKREIEHKDYNSVFWFNLAASVVLYVILFFAAPLIAEFYKKPVLTDLSRLFFLSFLFSGTGVAHNALLMKNVMAKERAKIDILALLSSGIVGVVLALKGYAYWGLAIQTVTYSAIGTLLRWYFSPWRPTFSFDYLPIKNMFSFSFKLFLTNIFWQINLNIFSVLLGKFYSEEKVGYYSQGNKWMNMGYTFISGMINGVAQPILTQVTDDKDRQLKVFRKMLRFGAFISFPFMLGLAFVGQELFFIVGGSKWINSVPFLQLFCIWGAVGYIWNLYTNLLMSHGKSNIYLWGMLFVGALQLAAVGIVFPYGIYPMVIAYIISFFIGLLFWHYFANKLIGLRIMDVLRDILPYLVITLGVFVITYFVTIRLENMYILFGAKIFVAIFLYITAMWCGNSIMFKECVQYLRRKA